MSEEGGTHSGNSSINLRDFRKQKKSVLSHQNNSTVTGSPRKFQRIRITSTSESDSDDSQSIPQTAAPLRNAQNGNRSQTHKNPVVLEKERQMRFLMENYPNTEAMEIHNLLSKYLFDPDMAAMALSEKMDLPTYPGGFKQWKLDRNLPEFQKETPPPPLENLRVAFKRKAPSVFENNAKKKVKRSRVENRDSDDSSAGSGGRDFRDRRVYNSSSDEDSEVEISDVLTPDKRNVLDFFQNATPKELELMTSCSKKKAEAIVEVRPFKGWVDLVEKLQENKNLSTDLLNAAHQVIITRNNIKQLMRKCTSLAQQMERAVAAGAGVIQQPRILSSNMKLTSYQMVGLNWLAVLHNQGVNGILADEMGLGKTVQVIAFLAHLKEMGRAKHNIHLVVVPSSTLDNWRLEFERWCPSMRVFMYYGSTEERRQFRIELSKGGFAQYDVLLTTYTMVGNSAEEKKMFRVTPMHYVVFDEAHMLKNMNTRRYDNLVRINAANRILLTGTPLQNNLLELMSLLIFVMPKMFAEKAEDLKSLFQKTSKSKDAEEDDIPTFEKEQVEQAKRIMKPFVLRRLKEDVLQDLPKKTDSVVHVPMVPTQRERYEELVDTFQNASKNSENPTRYNGMTMMTDLRKLSNHPLLLRYHYQLDDIQEMAKLLADDPAYKDTKEEYIVDDLLYMSDFEIHTMTKQYSSIRSFELPDNLILTSGKFSYLDKKLEELKQGGHRVLIFSQYVILLNVMEEYLKIRQHSYLRLDGSTPVNIRQQLIDEYTEDDSIFIFLLSTRAGGLGINLTVADTVIIHDIDFNPYNDKQAEDRCHRMGQQKPVQVYRLISQGTIEEGMWQMNKEKLRLERDITTDEGENPDVKSVVRLLSSVLGIDANKATNLVSPKKKM